MNTKNRESVKAIVFPRSSFHSCHRLFYSTFKNTIWLRLLLSKKKKEKQLKKPSSSIRSGRQYVGAKDVSHLQLSRFPRIYESTDFNGLGDPRSKMAVREVPNYHLRKCQICVRNSHFLEARSRTLRRRFSRTTTHSRCF